MSGNLVGKSSGRSRMVSNLSDGQRRPVGLIASAAYCTPEITAEFGLIPPSFLPFRQQRLFQYQAILLQAWCDRVFMSLPETFNFSSADAEILEIENVEVLRVPDGLNLVESIRHCVSKLSCTDGLYILHGDTLIFGLNSFDLDSFALAPAQGNYSWGRIGSPSGKSDLSKLVLAGLFSISNVSSFQRCLEFSAQSGSGTAAEFVDVLDKYSDRHKVSGVEVPSWLDFGHLQNLYESRRRGASTRAFNSLKFTERAVTKTGSNLRKLSAEAEWFETLPSGLRVFTPPLLSRDRNGYSLGFEASPTVQDLFIFGEIPRPTWDDISDSCLEFLTACSRYQPHKGDPPPLALTQLSSDKTHRRLLNSDFFSTRKLNSSWRLNGRQVPNLLRIMEETTLLISEGSQQTGILHGDLCFSNLHYDFRQKLVKVIDPRGVAQGSANSIYGDQRYDLAKLLHSIQGYDLILSGRYRIQCKSEFEIDFSLMSHLNTDLARRAFGTISLWGHHLNDLSIKATAIQLFLSMIPLHGDRPDRQVAFLANALRLYMELES